MIRVSTYDDRWGHREAHNEGKVLLYLENVLDNQLIIKSA